jgi:chorismate mutase
MSPAEPNLATIRREIDSIDDSIHDLIMRRTSLIEQIRAAKVRRARPRSSGG